MHLPFPKKSTDTGRRKRTRQRRLRFEPLEARHLLATFMVSNLDDGGPGSLRQAVLDSNDAVGADGIEFQVGLTGTIQLTSGQIEITDDLTLTGPGAEKLTIDAQRNSRIFQIARNSGLVTIDGLTLTRGKTVEQGGAIRSVSAPPDTDDMLKIRNSVITGNTADHGGGGVSGFHIQLLNSTVSNNDSIFAVGGIQGDTIDIRDSDLLQNMGNDFYGSAAHSEHSLTIRDSSVSGNTGDSHTVSSFGNVLVTGSTVANNTAQFNAGIYGVSIRIHDSTITGNTASGGHLVYGRGKILITESTISGNSAFAVFGDNDVTVSDSTISDNGGGVDSSDNVIVNNSSIIGNAHVGIGANRDVTVTNSDISGNARQGIRAHRGLELSDSTVSNNGDQGIRVSGTATVVRSSISGNLGAGIGAGKSVTATQSTIIGNDGHGISAYEVATVIDSSVAQNSGSGVIGDEGVAITGSAISNNRNGGVFSYQAVEITNCAISGNTSQHHGGGVFTSGDLTVIGSTISENTAMDRGGGIYIFAVANLTVINSTISGNSAQRGGGIDADRARIVVSNSTITQNNAGISGAGGIFADQARSLSLHSSIVAGNFAGEICALSDPLRCVTVPADISRLDAVEINNSLIGDANGTNLNEAPLGFPDADGNLIGDSRGSGVIDPLLGPLQDNGGPTETHLLLAGSPAIDTGANPLDLEFDQRGLPRQFSTAVDMGAVEVHPVIFVVDSTGDGGDANPGDGVCGDDAGSCTLRAAIEEANALVNSAFPDEIHFAISGDGPHTIQPLSPLPTIRDAVIIDGTSQSSISTALSAFDDPPHIEIDGSLAGEGTSGLKINRRGGGSTIRGLIINRFDAHGIFISRSDGNHVEQNLIGTDPTGTVALGNGDAGVMIINGADNVLGGSLTAGGGNVVSANRRGVVIAGRLASGNQVLGNLIGVDASGVVALGNRGAGVEISGAPNNHVGATVATADGINVISGNRTGVEIRSSAATGNTLALNKIGTDLSATVGLPNRIGVSIRNGAAENDVRGNLISGNSHDGVKITRANDNHIGSNRIGHQSLGNGGDGVDIRDGQNNLIGRNVAPAPAAAARLLFAFIGGNSIAANAGYGVNVVGDGNVIEANTIGTSTTGNEGNQRGGVQILNSSDNVVRHNSVFNNEGPGVLINGTTAERTLVQGNRIGLNAAPKISDVPSSDVGNSVGIEIRGARNNLIGGTAEVEGNLITQNERYGVHIHGEASGNRIEGNQIGTATFTFELPPILITADSHTATLVFPPVEYQPTTITRTTTPNRRDGIFVEADGNVIGGSAEGAGNVISGNGRHGVLIKGDSNRVEGNRIGPEATGFHDIPNGADGVRVHGSTNIIGGSETGAGNKISLNGVSGIRVSSGTGNVISQNSVFDNGGLGIDLGRQGTNANDAPLDADRGANNLQNSPEIITTRRTGTHLQIIFRIPSQPPHSAFPIRAEFFLADDDGEEGESFLASTDVALFTPTTISIPLADLPPGAQLVATASDADGNTSEFSAPFAAEPPAATIADETAADLIFQDLGQ